MEQMEKHLHLKLFMTNQEKRHLKRLIMQMALKKLSKCIQMVNLLRNTDILMKMAS